MVNLFFHDNFKKKFSKIKDKASKIKIYKQLTKIKENPETGKPMMHSRKSTREVYVGPFRLSYGYLKKENRIVILDIYHKDEQ